MSLLAFTLLPTSLILQPAAPVPTRSCALTPPLLTASLLEKTRNKVASKIPEPEPGARYRAEQQPARYYEGRNPVNAVALKRAMKDIGKRKLVVITGSSSGLGLYCFEALLKKKSEVHQLASFSSSRPQRSALQRAHLLACRRVCLPDPSQTIPITMLR